MTPEIVIEDPKWNALDMESLCQTALNAVAAHLGISNDAEVSVMACNDDRISELNAEFREKDKATNVLSWPAEELSSDVDGAPPLSPEPDFTGEMFLGDIAISFDTCTQEAEQANKPLSDHVIHLIIHGCLHLLGYDHETDADAALMERLEVEILGNLGISNPYIEH